MHDAKSVECIGLLTDANSGTSVLSEVDVTSCRWLNAKLLAARSTAATWKERVYAPFPSYVCNACSNASCRLSDAIQYRRCVNVRAPQRKASTCRLAPSHRAASANAREAQGNVSRCHAGRNKSPQPWLGEIFLTGHMHSCDSWLHLMEPTMERQDWKSRLPLIRDQFTRAPVTVEFSEWKCQVMMEKYHSGGISLRLVDETGPVARATVNIPGAAIAEDQILVKDYEENEGVLQALITAGLLTDTGQTLRSGNQQLHVAQLSQHVFEQCQAFQTRSPASLCG